MSAPDVVSPQLKAGIELLRRSGLVEFQIRFQDDETPTVWIAVGAWSGERFETASALAPDLAVRRLVDQVVDGGECAHCHRPTVVLHDASDFSLSTIDALCAYWYDIVDETYRRACRKEGRS